MDVKARKSKSKMGFIIIHFLSNVCYQIWSCNTLKFPIYRLEKDAAAISVISGDHCVGVLSSNYQQVSVQNFYIVYIMVNQP